METAGDATDAGVRAAEKRGDYEARGRSEGMRESQKKGPTDYDVEKSLQRDEAVPSNRKKKRE